MKNREPNSEVSAWDRRAWSLVIMAEAAKAMKRKVPRDPELILARKRVNQIRRSSGAAIQRALNAPPLFYQTKEDAPKEIHFEPDFAHLAQTTEFQELSQNPTQYIEERLPNIPRKGDDLPSGKAIYELMRNPYDISRIKVLKLGEQEFVTKRVDPRKVKDYFLEEYEIIGKAIAGGIPTPRRVGYIRDQGNTYLIFEKIPGTIDVGQFSESERSKYRYGSQEMGIFNVAWWQLLDVTRDVWQKGWEDMGQFSHWPQKVQDITRKVREAEEDYRTKIRNFEDMYRRKDEGVSLDQLSDEKEKALGVLNSRGDELRNIWEKHLPDIERVGLGASITVFFQKFRGEIMEKCKAIGIYHKDLEARNILLQLDKDGRILPDENGNAKLWVIDWEQQ